MDGYTDAELAALSDEERAALGADDDEKDALTDVVGETDDDESDDAGTDAADNEDKDGDQDGDDTGEDADVTAAAPADKTQAKAPPADEPAVAAADDDDEPFVPRYVAPPVENYAEQVTALNTERAEVLAKFKSGDLETDEMDAQLRAIDDKRRDLDQQKFKADFAAETAEQTAQQAWQWEIGRFMRQAKAADGIDYKGDAVMNAALDAQVKALGSDAKYADKPSAWFLQEAHRLIKGRFGKAPDPAADTGKDGGNPKPKPKIPSRKPDLRGIPTTLSQIPGAGTDDSSTGGDGEFAHLAKLSGMELEAAVAGMSKAQQERWYNDGVAA